jgi:hypothetical protein
MIKGEKTTLNLTIHTDYIPDSQQDEARFQIDFVSRQLRALFWFIKTTAWGYSLLDAETDNALFELEDFRENAMVLCDLGIGLSEELTLYSCRTLAKKSENSFASVVSELLKNPELPQPVGEAIREAINEMLNDTGSKIVDFDSPETIGMIFSDYEQKQKH